MLFDGRILIQRNANGISARKYRLWLVILHLVGGKEVFHFANTFLKIHRHLVDLYIIIISMICTGSEQMSCVGHLFGLVIQLFEIDLALI